MGALIIKDSDEIDMIWKNKHNARAEVDGVPKVTIEEDDGSPIQNRSLHPLRDSSSNNEGNKMHFSDIV